MAATTGRRTAPSNRTPLMAGNWKMNLDHLQGTHLVQKLDWTLPDAKHDYGALRVAVLAPSTPLRGAGTWDADTGEHSRVTVTLATGIPEDVVRSVNLNYLDPASIDIAACEADRDTFVVHDAGEFLFRLRGQDEESR